jgi:hypothetical protein
MIYDPITRQQVTIVGRYPPQAECYRFGKKVAGEFYFAKVRYGEHLPGFSGGFSVGSERDSDLNYLVASDGYREIRKAYDAAPEVAAPGPSAV